MSTGVAVNTGGLKTDGESTSGVSVLQTVHTFPVFPERAGKLLDVRNASYIENPAIWIQGERIKEIGSRLVKVFERAEE